MNTQIDLIRLYYHNPVIFLELVLSLLISRKEKLYDNFKNICDIIIAGNIIGYKDMQILFKDESDYEIIKENYDNISILLTNINFYNNKIGNISKDSEYLVIYNLLMTYIGSNDYPFYNENNAPIHSDENPSMLHKVFDIISLLFDRKAIKSMLNLIYKPTF